jgi:uncharacterized protein (TIGR03437 family)
VISALVNAASYEPTLATPGSIVTIFGSNLAITTAVATSVTLPLQLGGASVTQGGVAAPLFYASPSQINFQASNKAGGSFVVTTSAGSSSPYDPSTATPNALDAGGIFTLNSSGCGQGAVLNDPSDGSVSVNSMANSASPGDYVSIFGTGLVEISPTPIGSPAPDSPPAITAGGGLAWDLGAPSFSLPPLIWSGLAPELVGVDQINAQIPANTREGCAVPLQFAGAGLTPPVTIAIRNGGGQCVDPPSAGYGQIIWQKTVSTTSQNVATETDSMTALFEASPGQQALPTPMYADGCPGNVCDTYLANAITLSGPSCAVPGYRSLGAGTVTIQGPSLSPTQAPSAPYQQEQLGGISAYQAVLPAGTIQAGSFTVTASGGTDVGAFQAALKIGSDIQIQTPLEGIVAFSNCASLTIAWTGGDPKSWITVRFIEQEPGAYGGYQDVPYTYQTHTSNATMTIPSPYPLMEENNEFLCMNPSTGPGTIAIEVDPDPSEIATFSASGISLGGQATWKYVHNFQASF